MARCGLFHRCGLLQYDCDYHTDCKCIKAKKYNTAARDVKRKLQQVEKYALQLNQLDVPTGVAYRSRKTGGIMVLGVTRITENQMLSEEIISNEAWFDREKPT